MCIVIDYADPSAGNPTSSVGGCGSVKQGDGQTESGDETFQKAPKSTRRGPQLIKNLHL